MDNKKNYVVQSVPPEALCASNYSSPKRKLSSILSTDSPTLRRGYMLGIVKPVWLKVLESELRQKWLE